MKKKLALLLALGLLVGACSSVSTNSDEAAITYTGGPIEGVGYDGVVGPGSGRVWLGVADNAYVYPTTTRTYIVSSAASEAGEQDEHVPDAIEASTSDGGTIRWELAVYFKLNLTLLRSFHENIGQKYDAWETGGWRKMLKETLRQQLEAGIQTASRKYTVDQYKKDPEILTAIQTEIARKLKDNVNEVLGNDYFCGPTFNATVDDKPSETNCPDFEVVVKKPNFTGATDDAYNAEITKKKEAENARLDNVTKLEQTEGEGQRKIRAAELEVEAFQKLLSLIQTPGYLEFEQTKALKSCAANPECTFVVTSNADGSININTGS